MHKKALERETLIKLIVAAIVMISLVYYGTNLYSALDEEEIVQLCRMSVEAQGGSNKAIGSPLLNLKCPRKTIIFSQDGYKRYYADKKPENIAKLTYTKTFDDKKQYPDEFNKLLADEMAECWYNMGEGNIKLFSSNLATIKNTCLICTHITFSQKNLDFGTVGEFRSYLTQHNFTKQGINTPYYEFMLRQYQTTLTPSFSWGLFFWGDDSIQLYKSNNDRITSNNEYLVYFKGIKLDKVQGLNEYIPEQIRNEFLFPTKERYYVFFTAPEDITKNCKLVVN